MLLVGIFLRRGELRQHHPRLVRRPRGRFTTGSESSASNQAGQAYSGGGGEGGTYEVLGGSVGATIRIKWGDGSVGTATVHFVVDGQITEIKYGERLYGKALC